MKNLLKLRRKAVARLVNPLETATKGTTYKQLDAVKKKFTDSLLQASISMKDAKVEAELLDSANYAGKDEKSRAAKMSKALKKVHAQYLQLAAAVNDLR